MTINYTFNTASIAAIAILKKQWLVALTSPQDDMWESFRDDAIHWEIKVKEEIIGYACVNENNVLLQFYIVPKYALQAEIIFEKFIKTNQIKCGIVGTNNPTYLSIALNFVKDLQVHTCLFRAHSEVDIKQKEGVLNICESKDIASVVDFGHRSIGAPKVWLMKYINRLVERKEVYMLQKEGEIIGTCEVRKSETAPEYRHIGMIVSPDYRKQGYGTYLLHRAKNIAILEQKQPICSCEKGNIGSLKAISNCGFFSEFQLLNIVF